MKITYVEHKDIDKEKWDACIKNSFNGIIYAFSWYLDIVCFSWDGLVEGDYRRVMPLPFVKKLHQYRVVVPRFVKHLGVFSLDKLTQATVDEFIDAIPSKFKEITIALNTMNKSNTHHYIHKTSINYQIDLIEPYDILYAHYNEQTKGKIAKARIIYPLIKQNISTNDFMDFVHINNNRHKKLTEIDTEILLRLVYNLTKYNLGEIYGINDANGTLVSAAFFLIYLNRVSLLGLVINDNMPEADSEYVLIDEFIRNNALKSVTFDFIKNALDDSLSLNIGFGASETKSTVLYQNTLPFYIRFLKRY